MKPAFLLAPLLALAACTPSAPRPDGAASPSSQKGDASPSARPASAVQGPVAPAAPPAAPAEPASPARWDGYGALRLGMDEAQARVAWRDELQADAVASDNCAYLRPKADETFRRGFMFEGGVLVRYDVASEDDVAPGGGRVGRMQADIERLYPGRVQVKPHEYVSGGKYLRVTDPALADGALVFETDGTGKVTRWRVGRAPQVDYVEGCA